VNSLIDFGHDDSTINIVVVIILIVIIIIVIINIVIYLKWKTNKISHVLLDVTISTTLNHFGGHSSVARVTNGIRRTFVQHSRQFKLRAHCAVHRRQLSFLFTYCATFHIFVPGVDRLQRLL